MESPNYAEWIPEAGGYVSNGKVVSKTPIFAEGSKQMQTTVDLSKLQNQASSTSAPEEIVNKTTINETVSNANQKGSGQDANAMATQAGALAALAGNTAMGDTGVLDTTATKSNVVEVEPLTPEQKVMADYDYMVKTNNLQGQINALTELSRLNGVDYSSTIESLKRQRVDKIMNQDDKYSQAISNAYASGDYETAAELTNQRNAYRDSVGYQDALQSEYEIKAQENQIEYETTYMQGVYDITSALLNQVSALLNFQYDPSQDRALQIAQGYAVGAVKEQMNHTGMYYSSMTQGAITRAVAELVPVYEKMAKDEIKENISILQSTANFLMNLEQTQFNLWKGQLEVQWEANAERRKEYQAALDRTNAWGYVSNDDAAILGVEPGSLSPDAIKEARALQQQLEKEARALQSQMAMAEYNTALDIQKMQVDAELDDWKDAQKQARGYQYDSALSAQKYRQDSALSAQKYQQTVNETILKNALSGESSSGDLGDYQGRVGQFGSEVVSEANTFAETYGLSDVDLTNSKNAEKVVSMIEKYAGGDFNIGDFAKDVLGNLKVMNDIENNAKKYGSTKDDTKTGISNSLKEITSVGNALLKSEVISKKDAEELISAMYSTLVDTVIEYQSDKGRNNDFDYEKQVNKDNKVISVSGFNLGNFDAKTNIFTQGDAAKEDAIIAIINDAVSNKNYSKSLLNNLATTLSTKGYNYSKDNHGYLALNDRSAWSLIDGYAPTAYKSTTSKSKGTSGLEQGAQNKVNDIMNNKIKVAQ